MWWCVNPKTRISIRFAWLQNEEWEEELNRLWWITNCFHALLALVVISWCCFYRQRTERRGTEICQIMMWEETERGDEEARRRALFFSRGRRPPFSSNNVHAPFFHQMAWMVGFLLLFLFSTGGSRGHHGGEGRGLFTPRPAHTAKPLFADSSPFFATHHLRFFFKSRIIRNEFSTIIFCLKFHHQHPLVASSHQSTCCARCIVLVKCLLVSSEKFFSLDWQYTFSRSSWTGCLLQLFVCIMKGESINCWTVWHSLF